MAVRFLASALLTAATAGAVSAQPAAQDETPTRPTIVFAEVNPEISKAFEPIETVAFLEQATSAVTGLPVTLPPPSGELAQLALRGQDDGVIVEGPAWLPRNMESLWTESHESFFRHCDKVGHDFENMYTGKNLYCLLATVGIAAPMANTYVDERIQNWYRRHVHDNQPYYRRVSGTNEFWNSFGEFPITVPVFIGAWALGSCFPDRPVISAAGQWGERTLRALLVGAPSSAFMQYTFGGGRPGEGSHWRFFQDTNTVAGHGFVGAVPFLTAASMTECRPLRWALVAASFGTVWARLDRDSHYTSQCILGWTIAYLAVQSVSMTELQTRNIDIVPLDMPGGGAGFGLRFKF